MQIQLDLQETLQLKLLVARRLSGGKDGAEADTKIAELISEKVGEQL